MKRVTSVYSWLFLTNVLAIWPSFLMTAALAEDTEIQDSGHQNQKELLNEMNATVLPTMNWDAYQDYDVILEYCRSLAARFPFVSFESIGVSTEGRQIPFLRIGQGKRPGIFLDGGMHAAEWISVATVTYIVDKVVNNQELLDTFDWYIVPIVNVDGYKYTFTTDRRWRKTRSGTPGPPGCLQGVDANRNFDYHWGEAGSSDDPCSFFYRGPKPFSEPETLALSNIILSLKSQLKMYVTFHCYGQYVLLPWSYSDTAKPEDYNDLLTVAEIGTAALEATNGTKYKCGTSSQLVWPAAGSSADWAKGVAGIKYSYIYELPPLRDAGIGYFLPEEQIAPTGEETFNAIAAMSRELLKIL